MTEHHNKQVAITKIAQWSKWGKWIVLAVGIGIGFTFYMREPVNEPLVDAVLESSFYLAWFLWGVQIGLWGLAGILTRKIAYWSPEAFGAGPGETQGRKAVAAGAVILLTAFICFIVPGFVLALNTLLRFV